MKGYSYIKSDMKELYQNQKKMRNIRGKRLDFNLYF